MTTPISPGSSGGPVLNARGQLVALAKAIRTDGQALNFAVPVQYGMGLLTNNAVARPMAEVTAVASTKKGSPESSDSGVSSAELRSFLDDPAEGVERSATPREYLAGSYRTLLAWERTGQDPTYAMGWLFIASERRGIMVLTDSDQHSFLMPIDQARMTRDGRVALTFADDSLIPALSGVELANGRLVASGSSQKSSKRAGIALQEKSPPVTEVTGLYEIRLLGKRENNGKKIEWSGRAAVAVDGAGLAAIDMILVGTEDTGYGAFLSGTIDADGMISLKVKGTRMMFTGVLRDGAISGNVVLEWDDVTVTGRITGARE